MDPRSTLPRGDGWGAAEDAVGGQSRGRPAGDRPPARWRRVGSSCAATRVNNDASSEPDSRSVDELTEDNAPSAGNRGVVVAGDEMVLFRADGSNRQLPERNRGNSFPSYCDSSIVVLAYAFGCQTYPVAMAAASWIVAAVPQSKPKTLIADSVTALFAKVFPSNFPRNLPGGRVLVLPGFTGDCALRQVEINHGAYDISTSKEEVDNRCRP